MLRNAFNHLEFNFIIRLFRIHYLCSATGTVAVAQEDEILDRLYGKWHPCLQTRRLSSRRIVG